MNKIIKSATHACKNHYVSFFKYISLSDAGKSRGHQGGIYIPKEGATLMIDTPCKKGENKERLVSIHWFDGLVVENCKFIYYGKGTRNEFRITCMNRRLNEGDFLIMVKISDEVYQAYTLDSEYEVGLFYKKLSEE
mgnify:CR=1 FL=1